MEVTEANKELVSPYGEEGEAADDSPTSQLRHLKEISYILEKLRSNRTRFLLAAAHRRRRHLGSFAAKQKHEPGNPLSPEFAAPRQGEQGFHEETNLHHEYLLQNHWQDHQHHGHEQQESPHQKHSQRDGFSLDVELYSEARSVGSLSDVPARALDDAGVYREGDASNNGRHPAEATAAAAPPDIGAAPTYFCNRISPNYYANTATAAPAATYDRDTLPPAVDRSGALAPATVTAAGITTSASSDWVGSYPARRESLLQRAPVTLAGDDVDLYLGELLVPLLHDGLVMLCRLVELKQNDKTKQRLGLAFHKHFDPLRWLGQYLMRHHPKNGAAQPGGTSLPLTASRLSGSSAQYHQRASVSASASDQNKSKITNETDSFTALATADETAATAETAMPAAAYAAAARTAQAVTHTSTAETAHASTATAQATTDAAALAGGAEPAGAAGSAPDEKTTITAPVNLPASTTGTDSAAATAAETAAAHGKADAEQTVTLAASHILSTAGGGKLESLHKRRMQQYASFYGVIKDIVDEERSRRDFLLRREEVKQVFDAYCRERSDPRFVQGISGGKSRRSSCISVGGEQWGKRLSLSLRRRTSTVTDRIFSFAAANSGSSRSPRKFTTASTGRLSSAGAARAAERTATEAEHIPADTGASEGAAGMPTEEMVPAAQGAAEGRASRVPAGISPRARVGSRGNLSSGEIGEQVLRSEGETRGDRLPKATGEVAAPGIADGTEEGEAFDCIPVSVEDLQDILERLDAHWEMGGRLVAVFQEGLPIPMATEHADLIQYLLPEQERELVIEDPEDVQADEFWEFVKCYAEVHTWIRRELYNKRQKDLHVKPAANNQQNLVERLVRKKMVVVQQKDDEEEEAFQIEGPEKYEKGGGSYFG